MTTTDLDALFAACEAAPADAAPKLVLADALDEAGRHDLAHAYRWAGRRGKWPNHVSNHFGVWCWLSDRILKAGHPVSHLLPAYFFEMGEFRQERQGSWVRNSTLYDSFAAAFEALAVALAVLRADHSEWPSDEPSVRR